jgi:hypothetical protein
MWDLSNWALSNLAITKRGDKFIMLATTDEGIMEWEVRPQQKHPGSPPPGNQSGTTVSTREIEIKNVGTGAITIGTDSVKPGDRFRVPLVCECGQPARHWDSNGPSQCCACYIKAGNPPADWHSEHSGCVAILASKHDDHTGDVGSYWLRRRDRNS